MQMTITQTVRVSWTNVKLKAVIFFKGLYYHLHSAWLSITEQMFVMNWFHTAAELSEVTLFLFSLNSIQLIRTDVKYFWWALTFGIMMTFIIYIW
jgi:hypothetical protein